MENPVLLPRQQLAVAARRLPDPSVAQSAKVVVDVPSVDSHELTPNSALGSGPATERVEFELDELWIDGDTPTKVWRFDGKLFVDHWVEPGNLDKLRLFITLASNASSVEIHEWLGELVRVSAFFQRRRPEPRNA